MFIEPKEAYNLSAKILEKINKLPLEAKEFGTSITTTVHKIIDWVTDKDFVTDKQFKALKNINRGVDKWLKPRELRSKRNLKETVPLVKAKANNTKKSQKKLKERTRVRPVKERER